MSSFSDRFQTGNIADGRLRGLVPGGSLGALSSPWISRLRPPGTPKPELGGSAFHRGVGPSRDLAFSHGFHSGDPAASGAVGSSSTQVRQKQHGGATTARDTGRRELKMERCDMVAGFGPFQVRHSSGEDCRWRLESEVGACNRRISQETAGSYPGNGRGSDMSAGYGAFPFSREIARLGIMGEKVGDVARRDREDEGLLVDDERWRMSGPAGMGHSRNACVLQEASFFRQRGALCRSPNIGGPSACVLQEASFFRQRGALCRSPNIGGPSACVLQEASFFRQRGALRRSPNIGGPNIIGSNSVPESLKIVKGNQWLYRHRWRENQKHLDYHPASSAWTVHNESVTRPPVSVIHARSRGVNDDVLCANQHRMVSAQGAACKKTAGRTSYDIIKSNEIVQRQVFIRSSFWNFETIESSCVVSPSYHSLTSDGRGRIKRSLDPDNLAPLKSLKPRLQD